MIPITKQVARSVSETVAVQAVNTAENLLIPKNDEVESVCDEKLLLSDIEYFNTSSNMKDVRNEIYIQKKKKKFVEKVRGILDKIQQLECVNKDDNLKKIFVFVMQSAEDYIFNANDKERCEKVKKDICLELLRPFTHDNEKLCRQFMSLVANDIKKTTIFRRCRRVINKLFFGWLKRESRQLLNL
jgi:hypothetical protein